MKKVIFIVVVLVVLGVIGYFFFKVKAKEETPPEDTDREVQSIEDLDLELKPAIEAQVVNIDAINSMRALANN